MKILVTVGIVYGLFVLILFQLQRSLIYFPDKLKPETSKAVDLVNVVTSDGNKLEAAFLQPTSSSDRVILFFHGNGGNYAHRFFKTAAYFEQGYSVLLAEYRGYGGNEGSPSEEGLYKDGRAYIEWLIGQKKVSAENIILYGESLGSGVAIQIATEYDIGALVLETPFSSLVDIAAAQYFFVPVRLLLKDRFLNTEKIAGIKAPILIIHGHKDTVVPLKYAQKLFDAAKQPKKFIDFKDGNHNNLYEFNAELYVIEFLSGIFQSHNRNAE